MGRLEPQAGGFAGVAEHSGNAACAQRQGEFLHLGVGQVGHVADEVVDLEACLQQGVDDLECVLRDVLAGVVQSGCERDAG
ncbi:hypothetical protein SDC9_134194 [bioreactor metagenome]|uniref:Uncharacterized protein n=1 Tax=bioreactor metagenome TaxID=1076179 RepID=A0A645DCP5_9ZZZZ